MFRVKIGLVAAGLVVVLIISSYLLMVTPLAASASKNVRDSVTRANRLVTISQRVQGYDLVNLSQTIALRKEFIDGVMIKDEEQRRVATYDAINQFDAKLRAENRKAHFFGVVGTDGAIIARDLDIKNMFGEKLSFESVKHALLGSSGNDIWSMKNRMMRAAAAPLRSGADIKGAVAIAYDITAAEARQERDQIGTHVAYFMDNSIKASSFSLGTDDNTEDADRVAALQQQLLGAQSSPGKRALAEEKASDIFEVTLGDETYSAIVAPLPVKLQSRNAGYVVLASQTDAMKPVVRLRWFFVILALGTLLLVLGGMWVIARHFVNAEDKLELGVTDVINGNTEMTFESDDEFEGLANALNVMLARLLGRPEPGEEEAEGGDMAWRTDVLFFEEATTATDILAKVGEEPEDAYFARVHREYVEARKAQSLPVEGITLEGLTQKLKANEALLKAKHKCRLVRFQVSSEGGRVSLKPIKID
jgi:hypothetical protein